MKSVCFIIDDINFCGGAHVATFRLLRRIREFDIHIEILTLTNPKADVLEKLGGVRINVMPYPMLGFRRVVCGLLRRIGCGWYPVWVFDQGYRWHRYLRKFHTVCCVGEPSILRWFTASLPSSVRKVIMIHTDYSYWHTMSRETRRITRFDRALYGKMDAIGVVGKYNAIKMRKSLPELSDKIKAFHNIIDTPSAARQEFSKKESSNTILKIVTLSRLEWGPSKNTDVLIRMAAKLKDGGVKFDWDVYGTGERTRLDALVAELRVGDVFHMRGFSNEAHKKLAKADISVMLSGYEGLSNVIYESMMLGVPVFATNVGGTAEQIEDGITGWLVANDEGLAFEKLKRVLEDRDVLARVRNNLVGYHYDNATALEENLKILGLA